MRRLERRCRRRSFFPTDALLARAYVRTHMLDVQYGSLYSAGLVVPVARYNACGIVWHGWEHPVVAVFGVVVQTVVAAILAVFTAITY